MLKFTLIKGLNRWISAFISCPVPNTGTKSPSTTFRVKPPVRC